MKMLFLFAVITVGTFMLNAAEQTSNPAPDAKPRTHERTLMTASTGFNLPRSAKAIGTLKDAAAKNTSVAPRGQFLTPPILKPLLAPQPPVGQARVNSPVALGGPPAANSKYGAVLNGTGMKHRP